MRMRRCPFCGGRGTTIDGSGDGDGPWYAVCQTPECFCALGEIYDRDAMPIHHFHTKEDAEKAWNKRA